MSTSAASTITCRASPRSIRSTSSAGPTAVVVGITTAPSRMIASIDSHSSTRLPSITITESPLRTPRPASHADTARERSRSSANVCEVDDPSSSTTTSARASFPSATSSNQSHTQLNGDGISGNRKPSTAAPWSPYQPRSWSRLARNRSVASLISSLSSRLQELFQQ